MNWAQPRLDRCWAIVIATLLLAYALIGILPRVVPGPLCVYVLQPAVWLGTLGLCLLCWRAAQPGAEPADRRLLLTCAEAGLLQVTLYTLGGIISGYRLSPYSRSLGSLLPGFWLIGTQLLGVEASRWGLVTAIGRRRPALGVAVGWLLPWLTQEIASTAGPAGLSTPALSLSPYGWLPDAAENLLAAYMALVGGPWAALAYRSILAAFAWLSPALPNLTWLTAAFPAVGGPFIGWLAIRERVREHQMSRLLEHRVAERTAELARANARLQALSRLLVQAQEDERRRIARELHDEAAQALTSLKLGLGLLERHIGDPEVALAEVQRLRDLVDRTSAGLHRLATALRPASLDHAGLVPALRQYASALAAEHGLDVQFEAAGLEEERLAPEVETALFRIVQEALTNVVHHARASRADVLLQRRDGHLVAVVEDDGAGFDLPHAATTGRLGLLSMQERAELLGGTLTIETAPGSGATIVAELPDGHTHPHR